MAAAKLVDATAIDAEALSDLCCADQVVDIHFASHDITVPRGCDTGRLTTFVFTLTLSD